MEDEFELPLKERKRLIDLRTRLRANGYYIGDDKANAYYDENTKRMYATEDKEKVLRFLPKDRLFYKTHPKERKRNGRKDKGTSKD